MTPPAQPPEDDFLEEFAAALQADENDEAVYGWMVEEESDKEADC